jgi:ribonuclease-3
MPARTAAKVVPCNKPQVDKSDPAQLAGQLGYQFNDPTLLRQALTHRSRGPRHNERLEFLGDSVLNCGIAAALYERFPDLTEGTLSRLRANLVKQDSLAEIAIELKLGDHLLLGEGELKSGGFRRPSILADGLESIIGAIFLDGGFDAACQVVLALFRGKLDSIDPRVSGKDAKTRLQEWLQGRRHALPDYQLLATHGDAHDQEFIVRCAIPSFGVTTEGRGRSRRAAEQEAASQALASLEKQ